MKKEIFSAVLLTVCCLIVFSGIYTAIVWGIASLTPNIGEAELIIKPDGTYMYANIAQNFTDDKYFWSRPSAVDYNAAGSAGSNKGPSNPEYLAIVQARIDTFLVHNPAIKKEEIPADMVTASGSGLDPHISVQGAIVQLNRIARARNLHTDKVMQLIKQQTESPLLGTWGPQRVNVLRLNLVLDSIK